MHFHQAATVAGILYGNVLSRNSDTAGYNDAIDRLVNGTDPIVIAEQMMLSDEFVEKFLANHSAADVVKKLTLALCGWQAKDEDVMSGVKMIYSSGYKTLLKDFIGKSKSRFGTEYVPNVGRHFASTNA